MNSAHHVLGWCAAWLAAYWVHAGILHGGAVLLTGMKRVPLHTRDPLWRFVLLLPLATATTAFLFHGVPLRRQQADAAPPPARQRVLQVSVRSIPAGAGVTSQVTVRHRSALLMPLVVAGFLVAGVPATVLLVRGLWRRAAYRRSA